MKAFLCLMVLALALGQGCGDDDDSVNGGPDVGHDLTPGPDMEPPQPGVEICTDEELAAGRKLDFRMDFMQVQEPEEASVLMNLGLSGYLWSPDTTIEYPIIILIRGCGVPEGDGPFRMLGGSGQLLSGESFAFEADFLPAECDASMGGDHINMEPQCSIIFPVYDTSGERTSLRVTNVAITGDLSADGSAINNGVLLGTITEADAKAMTVPYVGSDMYSIFINSGAPMDKDTDGDGEMDAWQFRADVTAVSCSIEDQAQ